VEQKVKVQYSDADLAQAVRLAYKRDQEREGLFLHTVPARLAHILRRSRTSNPPSTEQTHTPAQIQEFLNERAEQLRKAGMNDLARQLEQLDEPDLAAESQLEQIEAAVIARLRGRTPVSVFKEAVDQEMKPHSKGKTQEQIERLRTQFTDRKLLDGAGIGRLSLSWL
jgi:hypothetical protein